LAGYIPRRFTRSRTVTYPSTNRARRRVTTLIETNALPLSQATNQASISNGFRSIHWRMWRNSWHNVKRPLKIG